MPRSERPNRKLRKLAGETKRKNGPSPLWGTDGRTANTMSAGGADSLWRNSGLQQWPSLFVGNISKIDGTRDAHFFESNAKKGKTIVMDGRVNNLIGAVIRSQLSETLLWEKRT